MEMYKNSKKINVTIQNIGDLENIPFDESKGIVVIEEAGVNISARKSMSDSNAEFAKLGMLGRKKNVDIIVVSQLDRMVDVYFRELSSYTFNMKAYYIGKDYLMFECMVEGEHGNHLKRIKFDLFKWSRLYGYSYNTIESSEMNLKRIKKPEQTGILDAMTIS